MFDQRRRRWANIKSALVQRLVQTGPQQKLYFHTDITIINPSSAQYGPTCCSLSIDGGLFRNMYNYVFLYPKLLVQVLNTLHAFYIGGYEVYSYIATVRLYFALQYIY